MYVSENWTITTRDARRIIAAEMKYVRITVGLAGTGYKTNTEIANELKTIPDLDKVQYYRRNWIRYVNRMPRNRLPRAIKNYKLKNRRNQGRDYWMCETGTDHQVVHPHNSYMMISALFNKAANF